MATPPAAAPPPVRLRLVFDSRRLLRRAQRDEGLRRCWLLLRSELATVAELAEPPMSPTVSVSIGPAPTASSSRRFLSFFPLSSLCAGVPFEILTPDYMIFVGFNLMASHNNA
ncbi:hypothetical protein PR202_gb29197 [Eleusine coracana subsp. coracana]|uniref:Uncharacterized protein n=1 Tax=Eleusine coracana subsp. coracana TaxID=191504 RepID=A0AAV5FWH1_ELECO|nr:hypothetical protein PR202_gb29197 [Eleusine coracana subsp. coracana]